MISLLDREDGCNLEDALVALGKFSDIHPSQILSMRKRNLFSDKELELIITMIAPRMADRHKEQSSILSTRIEKFSGIRDPRLLTERSLALKYLRAAKLEVEKADRFAPKLPEDGAENPRERADGVNGCIPLQSRLASSPGASGRQIVQTCTEPWITTPGTSPGRRPGTAGAPG